MYISSKIVLDIYFKLIKAKMALSRSTADESMTYVTNKHFFQQKVLCNTLQKSPSPNENMGYGLSSNAKKVLKYCLYF